MPIKVKVAVVGAGMSGLTAARILHDSCDVTVFEKSETIGGNAHTCELTHNGRAFRMDAGVCMFHTLGYPNFYALLGRLNIPTVKSATDVEILFEGEQTRFHFDLNSPFISLMARALSPSQNHVVRDAFRFYWHVKRSRSSDDAPVTLGEHLAEHNYSERFRLLLSFVCGSTWTINQRAACDLPLHFLCNTFESLGFFPTFRRGCWRHVEGSVNRYLTGLAAPLAGKIKAGQSVSKVQRDGERVKLYFGSQCESFEQVIFAISPEESLKCIVEPTPSEREVLSVFKSESHEISFHSDTELVRRWTQDRPAIFAVTDIDDQKMEMGRGFLFLAGFTDITKMCGPSDAPPFYMWYQFPNGPRPNNLLASFQYSTPLFDAAALRAQNRHSEISGRDRIHFCGSAWSNGIHEGAVVSALKVTQSFGKDLNAI